MPDEKSKYEAVPIPSYEEATGSSSRTSTPNHTPDEVGTPAESEGLLGADAGGRLPVPTRRHGYRPPPSVEDARESLEQHDTFLNQHEEPRGSEDEEEDRVRQEMEEMDIDDEAHRTPQSAWGKRISSISQSLSSIHLPFRWRWKWKINLHIPGGWRERIRFPRITADACIMLARCIAIILIMVVVYFLFMSDIFTGAAQRMGQVFDPENVRAHVQAMADAGRIESHMRVITQENHLAGTKGDYVLAQYVEGVFKSNGLDTVRKDEFQVYLNYPKVGGRKVEILKKDGSVSWSAKIDEDPVYTEPPRQQTPAFHGHSRSGDVTGPVIYANYGSREDFKRLYDKGIKTEGAIALVRYYGSQGDRALKVKAAEMAGFVGCIIYSDPADDGFVKGDVAPKGRYMPENGVQRGAVSLMSWVVGDVLTPGWGSTKDAERISKDNNPGLVNIPSVPLSWGDAQHLLNAIKGVGQACPDEWKGGIPKVEYWTGDLTGPKVHLVNDQDEVEEQPIWNVMGKITGVEQKEKSIIVGNHRDAWVYGASDPGSGTAVMLEVVHIFGDLLRRGWRPLRSIEFASWDGEEYNLIGSTEYVESNIDRLRNDGHAYLNVDVGVVGPDFRAAGSPVFHKALLRVLERIHDPFQNKTLRELWDIRGSQLEGLGAGSDYVAFQDIAGTSSLDFGFDGPPYPYHSAHDNFEWMATVVDPGFQYHKLLAQVWALLILDYADRLVMPFDMSAYSASLTAWSINLQTWVESKGASQAEKPKWSIEPLREAVLQFSKDATKFEKWELDWDATVLGGGGFESSVLAAHRQSHNNRMGNFETDLLDLAEGGGIPNRTQFKHVVFGPQLWSGYDEAFFPSIRDAVEAGNWTLAKAQVEKVAGIIKKASARLTQ